uniref:Endoglucanase n=1 Tax=Panchlora nivea TaxID=36955 RepID=A0A5A4LXT8_9NEOP|nr:beta-1,4-endoglucanase [Panchlora nivea]
MKIILLYFVGLVISQAASYDYGELLRLSLLFYEAQRSGKLPPDQKVTWRHDSALDDQGQNGEDLSGGYYDAGDYVKFGFPMAYTTTMLAWGIVSHESAYSKANALDDARKAVKWATDYFIKCHVSENEFYGQVGKGELDHDYWGRPEDMTMERPAYKIDESNPGSDLAAEAAAAMAATSIVFKNVDSGYSDTLITHAKQLYDFADNNRGKYSDSIGDAQEYYGSSSYEDELVWGAVWLYKATEENSYLDKAESLYSEFGLGNDDASFDWDSKTKGVQMLLAEITGNSKYLDTIEGYCDYLIDGQQRTPDGIVFLTEWGSLPSIATACFVCLEAANAGLSPDRYRDFATEQIGYILGDSGRSYVVGYGENPPSHEQHASSSCPDAPDPCDWDTFDSNEPNSHVLYGALVAGPDADGNYEDIRSDYVGNEVACDYNAGYQSALAALYDI